MRPLAWPCQPSRLERVRAAVGEDPLEPALEDGREVQPEHRRDERQAVGRGDLLPLLARVLGRVLADELRELLRRLVARPARRDQPPDRSTGHVLDEPLPEVHRLQDLRRHVLVQVGGHVALTEHRVEPMAYRSTTSTVWPPSRRPAVNSLQHRVAERPRVRMRVDGQDPHGATLPRPRVHAIRANAPARIGELRPSPSSHQRALI